MRGRYGGEEVMEAEGVGEISAGGTWQVGRHGEFHASPSHAQPWVPCKSTGSITASRCRLLWRAIRMLTLEGTA